MIKMILRLFRNYKIKKLLIAIHGFNHAEANLKMMTATDTHLMCCPQCEGDDYDFYHTPMMLPEMRRDPSVLEPCEDLHYQCSSCKHIWQSGYLTHLQGENQ